MNQPSAQEDLAAVRKHVRQHIIIAIGLAIGTLTTLWTSQTNFGSFGLNIAITLAIAAVQAFLVAGFFMHLLSEKKMIYCFLVFTAIFFVVQMGITLWARHPGNVVHYQQN
jgi:cytochrome c oxidase subunit IV